MKKMSLAIIWLLSGPLMAMELTPQEKEQRRKEKAAREEAAFEARMIAMREEQARRTQGSRSQMQESLQTQRQEQVQPSTQRPVAQRGPTHVEIPPEYEYKPYLYNNHVEAQKTNDTTCSSFTIDFCTAELEATYLNKGYKKVLLRNGLIGFCKPGKEHELKVLELAHQNMHHTGNH
jgi:ATPase subunit of ABC transporter with duplicated ATPase domains